MRGWKFEFDSNLTQLFICEMYIGLIVRRAMGLFRNMCIIFIVRIIFILLYSIHDIIILICCINTAFGVSQTPIRNNIYKEMFMRRLFRKLVLLIVLGMMLVGCSNKSTKKDKEEFKYFKEHPEIITPDDYIVWSNELNVIVDKEYVDNYSFSFWILSNEELKEEDIEVNIEKLETPYDIKLFGGKYTSQPLSRNYLLALNGINWKELEAYDFSDNIEEREKYQKIREEITAEYLLIPNDSIVELYNNKVNIIFDIGDKSNIKNEEIDEIKVNIKGKEYTVNIGKLFFKYEQDNNEYEKDPENAISRYSSPVPLDVGNEKGELSIPNATYGTTKDIIVKEFRLINADEDKTIESIRISNKSGEVKSQTYEKGTEISIPADSQFAIEINVTDRKLQNNPYYTTSVYLEVIYEKDDNIYSRVFSQFMEGMCNAEEAYSVAEFGIYVP